MTISERITVAVATDCKSLYDSVQKVAPRLEEKRTLIDIMSMRETLGGKENLRWVPTWAQVADGLTKLDKVLREKLRLWFQKPTVQLRE